jgi:hypothetical protein
MMTFSPGRSLARHESADVCGRSGDSGRDCLFIGEAVRHIEGLRRIDKSALRHGAKGADSAVEVDALAVHQANGLHPDNARQRQSDRRNLA